MGSYDPLAAMIFLVAILIGAFALSLEENGRPKWQAFALLIMVVFLCTVSAFLVNLGRKSYIPTVQQSAVFLFPFDEGRPFAIISRQRSRLLIRQLADR